MNPFSPSQREAISELQQLFTPNRLVLIGASALTCQLDMRWRTTGDLDITVAMGVDEIPVALRDHTEWERDERFEIRWRKKDVVVDIIPAGSDLLARGEFVLPKSGRVFSLMGIRHAMERSESLEIAPRTRLEVAPVSVIALLKIVAYHDRPERERDLHDLAYILEDYPAPDDLRRFDREVSDRGILYEDSGPHILGAELATFVTDEEKSLIVRFVDDVCHETDGGRSQALMLRLGPGAWRRNPALLIRKLSVFRNSLTS